MAEPRVSVLGPLQLSIDGKPVALNAPMVRAVLARLVVAGGKAVPAERLVADLWEGSPPATAASVLQVHVHTLRRLLEPDRPRRAPSRYLVSELSGYALRFDVDSVDAWQFEARIREFEQRRRTESDDPLTGRRLLDAALACWNGSAFEGLTTFGWAEQEAARLTELRLTAAELRAAIELELNRPAEVAIELRALFDRHPEREEIARLLATAQYRIGQQAQALATLRRSRAYLGDEYGIDPSPALRDLETAILGHAEALTIGVPAPAPEPLPAIRVRKSLSHSGYADELAALRDSAETAAAGHLQVVWIAGEAGAGKSTLAETALAELAEAGWLLLHGGCPEVDGAPPAWAWAEVLTALDAGAAETLVSGEAFAIARAVAALCAQRAAHRPVAILVEDAHRADTATLQVLRQLVRWLRDEPVFLVITLRGSEAGSSLHATAAALTHCTADWLELTGLAPDATREAARAAGLPEMSPTALMALHRRTGGNPLFIREIAKLAAVQEDEPHPAEIPESIRELIATRLHRLSAEARTTLTRLSIWGEGVDMRMLSLTTAIPEDELIDLIAEAESAALVRTDRTGRITFDHALIRDTVYFGIPRLRRVRMHWAALELLEQHADEFPGLGGDPDMLAHHAALGARPETALRAIEYVRQAARRSTDRGMAADTERLWRSMIDLHQLAGHTVGQASPAERGAVIEAHCALVNALGFQGHWSQARAARARTVALARELGDRDLLVQAVTCWRAPVLYPAVEPPDPAQIVVTAALDCLAEDIPPPDRVRLLTVIAYEGASDYRAPGRSRRCADEALELARSIGDPELLCTGIAAVTGIRFGHAEDADLAREMLDIVDRTGLTAYRTCGHAVLLRRALADLDLYEARKQIEQLIASATEAELPLVVLAASGLELACAIIEDDLPETERAYRALDDRMELLGVTEAGLLRVGAVATLGWARRDMSVAAYRAARAFHQAPEVMGPIFAHVLLYTDEHERARALYERYASIEPELYPAVEYLCRAYVALALDLEGEWAALYDALSPHAGTIIGVETLAGVFGPADRILGLLAAALGNFEAAVAHHEAAEAVLERVRADIAESGLSSLTSVLFAPEFP